MRLATILGTELLKLRRSKVTWLTWLAFSIAPGVGGLFMWIIKEPDRARALGLLGAKAQFAARSADWPSFAAVLAQMTGVGGMVLTAVIATYVFGREYADGTAKNMLALPVRRESFVLAKLLVVALWFAVLVAAIFVEGVAIGLALDLPGFSPELLGRAAQDVGLCGAMCCLLVPPVAWMATLGRGYLEVRASDVSRARTLLAQRFGAAGIEERDGVLRIPGGVGSAPEVARVVIGAGLDLHSLAPATEDLESHFLRLTGGRA